MKASHTILFLSLISYVCDARWVGPSAKIYYNQGAASRIPWLTHARDRLIEFIWPPVQSSRGTGTDRNLSKLSTSTTLSDLVAKYGGDVVLRFRVKSESGALALATATRVLFLDVWESSSRFVDIRLARDMVPSLLSLLPESMHNAHTPLIKDLAQAVYDSHSSASSEHAFRDHNSASPQAKTAPSNSSNIFFQQYQPLTVIHPWMRLLCSLFPSHVRLINLGLSHEGRQIQALRVGVHPSNAERPSQARKTIILAAGSHAREWIATSTVTFVAYSFITGYGRSREVTRLLEKFDFIFIPTINPDGYVYTWESDRFWRKNRQPTSLPFCVGMDLDHSFGYEWRKDSDAETPCAEGYGGEFAFEAVEAQRIAHWVKNETASRNTEIVAFLDFHSYSQQVLYPYSFSCTSTPPSLENLEELGIGLAKAIRITSGEVYGVTSACETRSPQKCHYGMSNSPLSQQHRIGKTKRSFEETQGGSALDYFYHELKIPYAYQIKLRDTGAYGFLLPEDNIIPTGREANKAVEYLGRFLAGDKGVEEQGIHDTTVLSHPRDQGGFESSEWSHENEGAEVGTDAPEDTAIELR